MISIKTSRRVAGGDMNEVGSDETDQKRGKWLVVALFLLVVFAGFVVASFSDLKANLLAHPTAQARCSRTHGKTGVSYAGSTKGSVDVISAKLQRGQREEVDFGRSLTSRTIILYLNMSATPKGPAYFHARPNSFVRADDADLRPQDIAASVREDGRTLILKVCFYRNGIRTTNLGDPGSYSGSITIDDSRLSTPVYVPITVTMQYANGVFLLWLYFGAIIPGAWCLWVIKGKRDGNQGAFSLDFLRWAVTINGLVAIVAGSVAAFAVYIAVYLRDPTWGSSALQPLTLYGGMFSAFVTTSGLASLTGKKT